MLTLERKRPVAPRRVAIEASSCSVPQQMHHSAASDLLPLFTILRDATAHTLSLNCFATDCNRCAAQGMTRQGWERAEGGGGEGAGDTERLM